ncbi:MAG: hypothetical protein PHU56_00220 [Candidatus Pacebacteria bacterium]|nr:hypothetical protein [Candidatus Paceibacterota bacterium]
MPMDQKFIITTSDTASDMANLSTSGLSQTVWVAINVASYPLTVGELTAEIILADASSSFNFATFSSRSFVDFEKKVLGDLALFNDSSFPQNTYGVNMSNAPRDIIESNTLTGIQKSAITLAIHCQNRRNYVIIAVSDTDSQTTFIGFLQSYNIPFATPEEIQKRLR